MALVEGQYVIDIGTKESGKVVGHEGSEVVIEVIVSQNKEDGTRTTKLIKSPHFQVRPFNPKKTKGKLYAPYFDVMEVKQIKGKKNKEIDVKENELLEVNKAIDK